MHAFGLSRAQLITHGDRPVDDGQRQAFEQWLTRRQAGEPIAYLTGRREFWSLDLNVTPAVLIPRPETELLVEQALARLPRDQARTVIDLGTGSGAVALAIARERPLARVIATDADTAALAVARANAQRLRLPNVECRHGDWFAPLADVVADVIVSNPPYIAAGDPHLRQGDLRFEPPLALVAGDDGLAALRQLINQAPAFVRRHGWLLLEHGYEQAPKLAALLRARGFADIDHYRDLAGQPRVIAGRWP